MTERRTRRRHPAGDGKVPDQKPETFMQPLTAAMETIRMWTLKEMEEIDPTKFRPVRGDKVCDTSPSNGG